MLLPILHTGEWCRGTVHVAGADNCAALYLHCTARDGAFGADKSTTLYCPILQGMVHAALTIYSKEGGIAGLWRGAVPAVQRAALVNLGELVTYDQVGALLPAAWGRAGRAWYGGSAGLLQGGMTHS